MNQIAADRQSNARSRAPSISEIVISQQFPVDESSIYETDNNSKRRGSFSKINAEQLPPTSVPTTCSSQPDNILRSEGNPSSEIELSTSMHVPPETSSHEPLAQHNPSPQGSPSTHSKYKTTLVNDPDSHP